MGVCIYVCVPFERRRLIQRHVSNNHVPLSGDRDRVAVLGAFRPKERLTALIDPRPEHLNFMSGKKQPSLKNSNFCVR